MQPAAGGGSGAGNVAAVLWNLRLHQHNIEHGLTSRADAFGADFPQPRSASIVCQTFHKINLKYGIISTFLYYQHKKNGSSQKFVKNAPTVVEPDLQPRRMEWILRVQQRKSTPFTAKNSTSNEVESSDPFLIPRHWLRRHSAQSSCRPEPSASDHWSEPRPAAASAAVRRINPREL